MYQKILKRIVVSLFIIILIYNAQFVINSIVNFNLAVSSQNFGALWILFSIEVFITLIFYDFMMLEIQVWFSLRIEELCKILIKKKTVSLVQFLIRVKYNLSRVFKFLRLGWIGYGDTNLSPVWVGISKSTLSQKIFIIVRGVISFPAMSAIILTLFTLNIINVDWIFSQWEASFEFLKKAFTIKINFGDVFSKLPAAVALLTILPALFFFYFYSQKREVRKIIDRKNKELFEIVVIEHHELSKLISKSIYTISENLDYVIKCQTSIVDLILGKEIKNSYMLKGSHYFSNKSVDSYLFKEIPEFQKMADLITDLRSEELDYFTRLFSVKRYEVWRFYLEFNSCKTSEKLNRLFFTKQGMIEKISKVKELSCEISKEELPKHENEKRDILANDIYDALEILYSLKRYNDSLKRYLTSSKTEKTLMKTLAKEK